MLCGEGLAHVRQHVVFVEEDPEPVGTPLTKESYLYRALFEELFPHPSAAACVPCGPSVACSSPAALAWDPSFAGNAGPSGRAVKGVHREAIG